MFDDVTSADRRLGGTWTERSDELKQILQSAVDAPVNVSIMQHGAAGSLELYTVIKFVSYSALNSQTSTC